MINYKAFGNGKPLVLFHGWGFDIDIWQLLVPYLINDFKIYLVDLPGFGKTPYMEWQAFKEEILSFLPDKFNVLGWSLGGLFATRLTIEEPTRVLKFINVTSSPKFISEDNWVGIDTQIFTNFHEKFIKNPHKTRNDFINSQLIGYAEFNKPNLHLSNDLNIIGLNHGLEILINWDLREQLIKLQNPGLFIFGKLDAIVSHKLMPILKQNYPNFEYVMFKKSAHMPFLSHLSEFLEVLIDFL